MIPRTVLAQVAAGNQAGATGGAGGSGTGSGAAPGPCRRDPHPNRSSEADSGAASKSNRSTDRRAWRSVRCK